MIIDGIKILASKIAFVFYIFLVIFFAYLVLPIYFGHVPLWQYPPTEWLQVAGTWYIDSFIWLIQEAIKTALQGV